MEDHTYLVRGSLQSHKSISENSSHHAWLLLSYSLIGVVKFIWVFWAQRHRLSTFKHSMILSFTGQTDQLRGVQNIHCTLIPLLFIDAMCAITEFGSAVAALSESNCPKCVIMTISWSILKGLGLMLHFVNALGSILYLHNPLWGPKVHSIAHFVTFLFSVLFVFYVAFAQLGHEFLTLILGLIFVFAFFKVKPPSPSAVVHSRKIALVALLTFLVVFAPHFILYCLVMIPYGNNVGPDYIRVYGDVLYSTNFHIYMDGLLFCFILKLPFEEEQQRHQHDMSSNPNYTPNTMPS